MAKKPDPTEPAEPQAGGSQGNTGPLPVNPDDLKTEQEKAGADPLSEPVPMGSTKASEPGVHARQPYPEGNPPDPEEAFKQAHGFARAKPSQGE